MIVNSEATVKRRDSRLISKQVLDPGCYAQNLRFLTAPETTATPAEVMVFAREEMVGMAVG